MADRCFDLTEFGDLLDLEPGDPREEHLARCPLCRSRLRTYRAFLEKQPAAGSRPADADAALERYISETVRQSPADRPAGEPGRGIPRLRTLSLQRFAVPALAAAAVVVLFLVWSPAWRGPDGPSGHLRRGPQPGGTEAVLAATGTVRPDGAIALSWGKLPEADGYQVLLFDTRLEEIARFPAGSDTALILLPQQLPALTGPVLWRVRALRGGSEVARSSPATLELRRP
jgi:hypothetical protein